MSKDTIVRGTMLLTAATFLSKFIGMIYVVPFNALVGSYGGALYSFAYTPYNILISFSTVGVPLAVSKFVAKYNSIGDYRTGMRMYRVGLKIMIFTGILSFLLMYFSADWLANLMLSSEGTTKITVDEIAMTLRMVSFALLIIPAMSITRGFFQGHQSMGPTAVSTVVEQVVRIAFIFIAGILILYVFNGTVATVVGYATFAAFVGAVGSSLVLYYYWRKRKSYIYAELDQQTYESDLTTMDLIKELSMYAGPFILVGLATPLYQFVDQFTLERGLVAIEQGNLFEIYYSAINTYGHKVILIPVTLATGLSLAIIPALTKAFTAKDDSDIHRQIHQALQIIFVLVIPACAGLVVLSDLTYGSLFGFKNLEITGTILAWYAPIALVFALFTVSAAILQGIQQQSFAVISLLAGLMFKILFNIRMIEIFGAKGSIFATGIAAGIAVVLNLLRMKKKVNFKFKQTFKILLLVLIFTVVMSVVLLISKSLIGIVIPFATSRMAAVLALGILVVIGGYVYTWLGYKSKMLEHTLGARVNILRKVMR